MNLTAKQEAFAKAVALEGKNQTQAYKLAYPTSLTWSDNAVEVNASKLSKNTKVLLRVTELKASMTSIAIEKASFTLEDAINQLKYACTMAKTNQEANNLIKGTVELAKMTGVYEEALKLKGDKENPIQPLTVIYTSNRDKK